MFKEDRPSPNTAQTSYQWFEIAADKMIDEYAFITSSICVACVFSSSKFKTKVLKVYLQDDSLNGLCM